MDCTQRAKGWDCSSERDRYDLFQESIKAAVHREIVPLHNALIEKMTAAIRDERNAWLQENEKTLNMLHDFTSRLKDLEDKFKELPHVEKIMNELHEFESGLKDLKSKFQEMPSKYASLQGRLDKYESDLSDTSKELRRIADEEMRRPHIQPVEVGNNVQVNVAVDEASKKQIMDELSSLKDGLDKFRFDLDEVRDQHFQLSMLEQVATAPKELSSRSQLPLQDCSKLDATQINLSCSAQEEKMEKMEDAFSAVSPQEQGRDKSTPVETNSALHVESQQRLDDLFHDEIFDTYEFQESVTDLMLFIGILNFGLLADCLAVVCFLANFLMVCCICVAINEPIFSAAPFDSDTLDSLRNWRLSDGHSKHYSYGSSSLVSRVCNNDPSLTMATTQSGIVSDVTSYLDSGGLILAFVAITFFVIGMAAEFRLCFEFISALWCIPKAKHTVVAVDGRRCSFEALSHGRTAFAVALFIFRLSVAMWLCYNGCVWLAYTDSIANLLLNASALNFVISLDQIIYTAFVPTIHIKVMRHFKPVTIPPKFRMARAIPFAMFFGTLIYEVILYFVYLGPFAQSMEDVNRILCGGRHDFIYGTDFLAQIIWTPTATYGTQTAHMKAQQQIINGIIYDDAQFIGKVAIHYQSHHAFSTRVDLSGGSFVNYYNLHCEDHHSSHFDLGMRMWSISGNETYKNLMGTCQDLPPEHFDYLCSSQHNYGVLMRYHCPRTCGCDSATSGLGELGLEKFGCPQTVCLESIVSTLDNQPCNDTPREDLKTKWNQSWEWIARVRNGSFPLTLQPLLDMGCEGINHVSPRWARNVCHYPQGASTFCPVTCNCTQRFADRVLDLREVCPDTCLTER